MKKKEEMKWKEKKRKEEKTSRETNRKELRQRWNSWFSLGGYETAWKRQELSSAICLFTTRPGLSVTIKSVDVGSVETTDLISSKTSESPDLKIVFMISVSGFVISFGGYPFDTRKNWEKKRN